MKQKKILLHKLLPDYIVNKWIFNFIILIMVLLLVFIWSDYDFKNPKDIIIIEVDCPIESGNDCENPLWTACNPESDYFSYDYDICYMVDGSYYENEFLKAGEHIGSKPSWLLDNYTLIMFILFFIGIILNHFLYNKHYDFANNKVKK